MLGTRPRSQLSHQPLRLRPLYPRRPHRRDGATLERRHPSPPDPPPNDGCVVSGRLSRLQADPTTNKMVGIENVLIEDWCQQYPSHSVGGLVFGSDGALYV